MAFFLHLGMCIKTPGGSYTILTTFIAPRQSLAGVGASRKARYWDLDYVDWDLLLVDIGWKFNLSSKLNKNLLSSVSKLLDT